MVLNPRGRGRGRGGRGTFLNKPQRGGILSPQGPVFRTGPPAFAPSPQGFGPDPRFRGGYFRRPTGYTFSPRGGFGKFPRKNFTKKPIQKNNEAPPPDVDLSKPWVTDEIKQEETKKQELLEVWRKSKSDDDWAKYKAQKLNTQSLYDKAKEEYLAANPGEKPTSCDYSFTETAAKIEEELESNQNSSSSTITKKSWMTDKLVKLIKIRDCLYKKYKSNPEDPQHLIAYKKFRNKLNKEIRKIKHKFGEQVVVTDKEDIDIDKVDIEESSETDECAIEDL